jgi:oligopeptide transport system substrate-binding protein
VKLDGVRFLPLEEATTMMNLYKSGRVDAIYNHTVPSAWFEYISQFKDEYLLHPEMSNEFYAFSVKKPPVDKVEVRRALSLSIDREALAGYMKTQQSLANFTPEGVFPEYDKVRKRVFAVLAKKDGISEDEWNSRKFDPKRACGYMEKAGYRVVSRPNGRCRVDDFPAGDVSLTYNTRESNKQIAEFVQAQWKQNLGIEIQIKNLEWKTYLEYRSKVQYKGIIRAGWVGDYIDPFAYCQFFYTTKNDSGTGWWSPKYDQLIEKANATRDPEKRLEILAEAEYMVLADQPVIPLGTQQSNWMKKPYVKGMYPNPGTLHPWKFIWIEKDPAKWDQDVDKIMTSQKNPAVEAQIADLMKTQVVFEEEKAARRIGEAAAAGREIK